ncbi:ABC transporter ATP-binding protein [soil metagenome]
MREQKRMFTIAVVCSVLYGGMTVADAWVLGWATDHVIRPSFAKGDVLTGGLVTGVLLFMSVALLRAVGVVGRRLAGGIVFQRLIADYRRRVTRKYLNLPLAWHQRHPTGQLLSNANADVEAVWAVFNPLPMAIGVIAMLVAAIASMLAADVVLTGVGLVVFPLLFIVNIGYQRWQSPRLTQAQSLRGTVSAVAHESFDGALVVKSLGREAEETERFAGVSNQLRDANIGVGRIRAIFDPLLEALPNIGILLVVLIGAARVGSGTTDPGDVVLIAYLFTVVAFPVRAIGWVLGELPRSVVGWERVRAVLDAEGAMVYGDTTLDRGNAVRLDVEDLSFSFEDAPDDAVLTDVSFSVKPGKVVAIVGATGGGKSTLTALLTRLMDAQSGSVRLDGVDLRDLTHESLAEAVSVVPQATFLFDDTVRTNVSLGADVSDDDVWAALRTVQAHAFVSALPDGLDTQLGERGTSLSGGQRQRLALARALVHRPRLLVMDDATSALDPEVEQRILRALAAETATGEGPTVLVVAYRKATIALADEVLFVSGGTIADRGSHTELLARSTPYRDLVDAYDQAREEVDHE